MTVNLVSLLQKEFSGDVVSKIAALLGESPAATQSAVTAAIPAVIGALAQKATMPHGSEDLIGVLQKGGLTNGKFGDLMSLLSSGGGSADLMKLGVPLAASLLGSRESGVTSWLSSLSGISQSSATKMLGLLVPSVMAFIGRRVSAGGSLNAFTLGAMLGEQSTFLKSVAPAGLANALGLGSLTDLAAPAPAAVTGPTAASGGGLGFLKWLLPLAAGIVLFAGFRACNSTPDVSTTNLTAAASSVAASAVASIKSIYGADLGGLIRRSLPDGGVLNIPERGVESQLVGFIEDTGRTVSPDLWFTLDRLEFETGSAALRPSAQEQLKNIAEILRAYPAVSVKIGGYTDSVGDDASNMTLSSDRAGNTMGALAGLGVARERLEAEGFGEQHPVASNDTEEGRQRNRRIDLRVTKK